jgi:hypothetical protein
LSTAESDATPAKATLAEWLQELRQDDIEAANYVSPNIDDSDEEDEESAGRGERRAVWCFPSSKALDEFVATIDERSEDEIDLVLRHLLIASSALVADHARLDTYFALRERGDAQSIRAAEDMKKSPHFRRIYAYFGGLEPVPRIMGRGRGARS